MSEFSLSKWYLDCITDEGETFVGYTALLRLGALEVHYANLLHCDPAGAVRTRTSLRRGAPPRVEGSSLAWISRPLSLSGRWDPLDPPLHETIHSDSTGMIDWHCHVPRARAVLNVDGRTVEGLGYAEQVTLTIPPWRLPIRELRWGRLLTPRESLVFIDWIGTCRSMRWVMQNGKRLDSSRIDESGIADSDGHPIARFHDNHVLRRGAIGKTALAFLGPRVLRNLPGSALLLDERKWRARGELAGSSGWAIHEVVRWP